VFLDRQRGAQHETPAVAVALHFLLGKSFDTDQGVPVADPRRGPVGEIPATEPTPV
jgi:hypothetical protein